jgi:hypothetical protein
MKKTIDTLISLNEEEQLEILDVAVLTEDVDSFLIFVKALAILLGFTSLTVALPKISGIINRYIDAGFDAIKKYILRKEIEKSEDRIKSDTQHLRDSATLSDLVEDLERNKQLVRMMNDFVRADKPQKVVISKQMLSYVNRLTGMGEEILGDILGDILTKYIHKNDVYNRY